MAFLTENIRTEHLKPDPLKPIWHNLIFGRKRYMLLEHIVFECYLDGIKYTIEVPELYITDFGTIPRIIWSILPPDHHHYIRATVVHDYCLSDRSDFSREECHDIFNKALKADKCPKWKRNLMVWATRKWNT